MKKLFLIVTMTVAGLVSAAAQSRPYEGPDDPEGDVAAERVGVMNGNRVYTDFNNNTYLSDWPNKVPSTYWPNDENAVEMHQGLYLVVAGRVYLEHDTIPVTDPLIIQSRRDLDTLYFVELGKGGYMDPTGTIKWGFEPVFGYFNQLSEYPAMSNRRDSWPTAGWPARGGTLKWPGEWNGRFGRGIAYADLETYFVANDAQNERYLQPTDRVRYYPRPGLKIGDKLPTVTTQKGRPWGGMGLRVGVRGLQWNNPQSRDVIFWEYEIANTSNYDLNDLAFGYSIDMGIGEWGSNAATYDNLGYFSKKLNMSYVWSIDGIGGPGLRSGIMGIAFLESPGVIDGKDNDDDGLTDERRDNTASTFVTSLAQDRYIMDKGNDTTKFRSYFGYSWKPHWDADEDGDWRDGNDANGNGRYDADEDAGDDVGLDGVGPNDLNYTGPDADGTECNHKPDLLEGIGAEPNFGFTDIGESDMLGLTLFDMFVVGSRHGAEYSREYFSFFTRDSLIEYNGLISNLNQMFSSSLFPLQRGTSERISMANLYSYEDLTGLNSSQHSAPSLFAKKEVVQVIYESDYRFAQPPAMPTLSAKALDGKVYLSWNDAADRITREPLLKGENDFEGYKLYKATDKYFKDAELLYDGYGNPIGKKPIYQCDIRDNKRGFASYGALNGLMYYLGDDTGIKHYFVDNDVQNGRTYYYALVAYDYGLPELGKEGVSIAPSENNTLISLDENETIQYIGKNVAIAVPHQMAAGYEEPQIQLAPSSNAQLKGEVGVHVFNLDKVRAGHTYRLGFQMSAISHLRAIARYRSPSDLAYATTGVEVRDITSGQGGADSTQIVYGESTDRYTMDNFAQARFNASDGTTVDYLALNSKDGLTSDVFDGLQLVVRPTVLEARLDTLHSGWVKGTGELGVRATTIGEKYFPWQYDIVFTDTMTATRTNIAASITSADGHALGNTLLLLNEKFPFCVINRTLPDSLGRFEQLDVIVHDVNGNKQYDPGVDSLLVGPCIQTGSQVRWGGTVLGLDFHEAVSQNKMPKAGDVYRVDFQRPFFNGDSLVFTVKAAQNAVKEQVATGMKDIKVVPNPYVMTNMMEPALMNKSLNQRRSLLFTHIPARSVIRIYTASGVFVDEIAVDNIPDDGTVHWDMLTKEGLEIAAGMYFYHVRATDSGEEHTGKFAVIK